MSNRAKALCLRQDFPDTRYAGFATETYFNTWGLQSYTHLILVFGYNPR